MIRRAVFFVIAYFDIRLKLNIIGRKVSQNSKYMSPIGSYDFYISKSSSRCRFGFIPKNVENQMDNAKKYYYLFDLYSLSLDTCFLLLKSKVENFFSSNLFRWTKFVILFLHHTFPIFQIKIDDIEE